MRLSLILSFILLQSSLSFASFEENSRRYMSYYDLINSMKIIFTGNEVVSAANVSTDCIAVTESTQADLAYNSPATGEPAISSPNSNYVRWIGNCVSSYFNFIGRKTPDTNLLLSEKTKRFLTTFADSQGWPQHVYFFQFHTVDLKSIPEDIQIDMIEYAFDAIFGSEAAFNQFKLIDAKSYKASVKEHLKKQNYSVAKALEVIVLNFLTRDEFLSY